MDDKPQVIVVEKNSGPGCLTSCLALIGLLVVLAIALPMCGLVSLGSLFSESTEPRPASPLAPQRADSGARIVTVDPSGKAAAAGLRPGDVIIHYAHEPIGSVRDLEVQVGWNSDFPRNKDPIRLTYIRGGLSHVTFVAAGKLGVTVVDHN